jgi:hypothetical protein
MSQELLTAEFGEEMHRIYQRALLEAHYRAAKFLQMLHEHGGLQTAQILLHSAKVSDGYTALWERGRLDLTVEAVIHDNPKWHLLFTPEELAICSKRLNDYGYRPHA